MNPQPNNQIRIIAGKWRGRKLPVLSLPGLRPTTDRIRETLFNWLADDIDQAYCLDLFAGSGVFGFESLSRGAKQVVSVDCHPDVVKTLHQNAERLGTKKMKVLLGKIESMQQPLIALSPFDIVFVDPPFNSDLLPVAIDLLSQSTMLKKGSLIYLESAKKQAELTMPAHWQRLKSKTAGQVRYQLYRVNHEH